MEVIWSNSGRRTVFNVPYTIGDIVKVIRKGSCVSNGCIKRYFGIVNCLFLAEEDKILQGFPDLDNNDDDWKIIDVRSPYGAGLLVLLRNRLNVYLCVADTTVSSDPIFSIVRKTKKRIETLEL